MPRFPLRGVVVSFLVVGLCLAIAAPTAAQQKVRVGGEIKEPKKIKDVKPVYPEDAKAAGVQGIVIIETLIGTDGAVKEAKVLRSVQMLDQAALEAVTQWRYTPTLLNGDPVEVIMTVTVTFTLAGADAGVTRVPTSEEPSLRR
jgi:protein TonB